MTGVQTCALPIFICIANVLDTSLDELLKDSLTFSPKTQYNLSIEARTEKERSAIVKIVKTLEKEIGKLMD